MKPGLRLAFVGGALTLSALLFAHGSTDLCAVGLSSGLSSGPVPLLSAAQAVLRPPRDGQRILDRNIFDSSPSEGVGPEIPVVPDSGSDCAGALRLVGVVHNAESPELSLASLKGSEAAPSLAQLGTETSLGRITEIASEFISLAADDGADCRLSLFAEPIAPVSVEEAPAFQPLPEVTPQGSGSYRVERSLVRRVLENPAATLATIRAVPRTDGSGTTLYGIRRGSPLSQLGLRNGDVLVRINGFDASKPDEMLHAYQTLRNAPRITLSVLRQGAAQTLEYEIEE